MNKKRYLIIIAIIVFAFLAVFTFANPFEKEEGEPNDNRVLEEIEEEDLTEQEEQTEEKEEQEEQTEQTVVTPVYPIYNNHGVVQKPQAEVDTSYEVALKAVEKLEITLNSEDLEETTKLVEKVKDEEKKEKLEERLEAISEIFNLTDDIETLVSKVNNAVNKTDMNSARSFVVSKDIVNRLNEISNEVIKDLLLDKLESIAEKVEDTNNPKVNIEDGAILNSDTKITVTDESEVTIKLNDKEILNNTVVGNGIYTLVVTDGSFNATTIKFTVDTVAPTGEITYSTTEWTNGTVVATLVPSETVTVTNNNGSFEYTFEENGSFTFEFVDRAGNTGKATATVENIDKTAPTYRTYKGTITQDKYEVEPIIIDGELYFFGKTTFNFNDNVVIKEQHVDNGVYIGWQQGVQKVFNTPGKHTVKMVDAAGNETSVTLTILDERLNITNVDELKTALDELDEITLYKDVDLGIDNPLIITAGQNKVINLNGKKITGKSTKDTTSNLIQVKQGASLRLEGNGEVSFLATKPDTDWVLGFPGYANNTIVNNGKLVIDGPTIINNTPKGGASYAIDNYPGADLEVLSGTITNAGGGVAMRMFANSDTVKTKVTISGGTIIGSRAIWLQLPGSNAASKKLADLTITGGTLTTTDTAGYNLVIYSYSYGDSFANTNVTITGGTFNGDIAFGGGYKGDKENVTITGGIFNGEVGRYLENDGWEDLRP